MVCLAKAFKTGCYTPLIAPVIFLGSRTNVARKETFLESNTVYIKGFVCLNQ